MTIKSDIMAPKDAASFANKNGYQGPVQQFLDGASARQVLEFFHYLDDSGHSKTFSFAKMALDIRLAEDAAKQAEALQQQVALLCGIADAQRILAAKLDKQTDRLIGLTRWLRGLTIGLVILTAALCFFEVLHFQESRSLAIRSAAHVVQPTTNAQQRPPL